MRLGEAQDAALALLKAAAPAGCAIVVATASRDWTMMETAGRAPLRLLSIAQSLLEDAADMLPDDSRLREEALAAARLLPDRFGDDAG
jgi:hypothetical protein